ncbi:LLM class flavin-dependent oxidoreductase [Asanoa siamensis]|uniref:N5,N10-methylene tetrahydromethanopterin reductase n=1 Tax=Asanoa siamensis TaxID=926357 RepID=A0ABQ4CJ33_9ACTN|nr:LLM class flavin-dependent oxidoreductase [Asanoa siamensis]GIF71311.1 N5,N10-methylene tetrahydromethanopterin reductase [Asanoa siamensis]
MDNPPIGVMFRCDSPPENLPAYAQLAERLGYDELWVVEDCFFTGAISAAAVAAASTESLKIGIGILPAAFRNPALAAMELSNLTRLFPGRILPGFGHGVPAWVRQVGAHHPSPLAVLEESIAAVRALLHGETVTRHGRHVDLDDVTLAFPPAEPPLISAGVRNEKSLRLAGRVADGTILAEGAAPAYIAWARERIEEGRAEAGRTDPHRVTVYAHLDFDDAARSARTELAAQFSAPVQPSDPADAETLAGLVSDAGGDLEKLAAALPDEIVDRYAIVGDAQTCGAALHRLTAAGADAVVFVPPRDPDLSVAHLTLAAEALIGG